jgi:hypothetical protein
MESWASDQCRPCVGCEPLLYERPGNNCDTRTCFVNLVVFGDMEIDAGVVLSWCQFWESCKVYCGIMIAVLLTELGNTWNPVT